MEQWKKDAFNHAVSCQPFECCGILTKTDGITKYWECKNIAYQHPEYSFVIDPIDWANVEDSVDEIIGVVHSHPDGELKFSETDIASCNFLEIRFYLVEPSTQSIIYIDPEVL